MADIRVIRVIENKDGTFGVLVVGDTPIGVTLELPWRDNEPFKSCIPSGSYTCRRVMSMHHGEVFEVQGVPGRSDILIHKGNLSDDTEGCILVGEEFGVLSGRPGILRSGAAFNELMSRLYNKDEITMEVQYCNGSNVA